MRRPRAQSDECGIDITAADQALHGGIDPAIERNVHAGLIGGARRRSLLGHDLQVVVDIGVVPLLVDLPADLIAHQAADKYIGEKVLVRGSPRQADSERQAIGAEFCQRDADIPER